MRKNQQTYLRSVDCKSSISSGFSHSVSLESLNAASALRLHTRFVGPDLFSPARGYLVGNVNK